MFRNQYDQVNLNFAALIWIINLPFQGCADVESAGAFAPDRMCVQFLKLFFYFTFLLPTVFFFRCLGGCEAGRCSGWLQGKLIWDMCARVIKPNFFVKSATTIVLVTLNRELLIQSKHQKKIFKIDDNIGIAVSGLASDAVLLTEQLRAECTKSKFIYGSSPPLSQLADTISRKLQVRTSWLNNVKNLSKFNRVTHKEHQGDRMALV